MLGELVKEAMLARAKLNRVGLSKLVKGLTWGWCDKSTGGAIDFLGRGEI